MKTSDFDFLLPNELIAQIPVLERDKSRLLVLGRASGTVAHRQFRDVLEYFRPGDVLVLNNSRVIPARLRGVNAKSSGQFEILLLEENEANDWWVMLRPGKRAPIGAQIILKNLRGEVTHVIATVIETNVEGHRRLKFSGVQNIAPLLDDLGEIPLPPYITRGAGGLAADKIRYQTVYAAPAGSVAAPTAGLHFTESLLAEIRARGVQVHFVTLHVGPGTFAPVKAETISGHTMHHERYEMTNETAHAIAVAKQSGHRVIAVGTTTVRVLESSAFGVHPFLSTVASAKVEGCPANVPKVNELIPGPGRTNIFIFPPYQFKIVDALLTNFHLPRSTLLMLVSAFAAPGETRGREMVLAAYVEAVRHKYRFFSYGDAMLVV